MRDIIHPNLHPAHQRVVEHAEHTMQVLPGQMAAMNGAIYRKVEDHMHMNMP